MDDSRTSVIASLNTSIDGSDIEVANGVAFADNGSFLKMIDVTDADSPRVLSQIATSDWVEDLAIQDQFAYVKISGTTIDVIDVSDPSSHIMVATTSIPSSSGYITVTSELMVVAGYHLLTLPLQCAATAGVEESLPAPPPVGWLRAFPNPTQGLTTIEVATQGPHAELGIYDLAGRLVRALPTIATGGARSAIVWDGRDARGRAVAGGAYWLRLEDGASVRTQQITVLR